MRVRSRGPGPSDEAQRPLRVLQVITRSEHGGAQAVVESIMRALRDQVEFHLALGLDHNDYLAARAKELDISYVALRHISPTIKPASDALAIAELVRTIRRVNPDIVHCHSSKAGVLGRAAARLAGVPAVFTAHGWAFAQGASVRRRQIALAGERLAANWAEVIVTVSDADRDLAIRLGVADEKKLTTIHNGIADSEFRSSPAGSRSNSTNIVVVARFAPQKDQALLLRALSRLKHHDFSVTFVGDGPELQRVDDIAKALGLAELVQFVGIRNDIEQILALSHLFVLPSLWEGLPISVIEAMRAGLPVIASDVGGCRELVVHGETGFLTPIADVAELTYRLEQLLLEPQLREEFGTAARRRYEDHFGLDRMLTDLLDVYVKCARRNLD